MSRTPGEPARHGTGTLSSISFCGSCVSRGGIHGAKVFGRSAELDAATWLLDVDDRRDAVEEREQHRRGEPLEAQQSQPPRVALGDDRVVALGQLAVVRPHVHPGPPADRPRAQQEPRDRARGRFGPLAAHRAYPPLGVVHLGAHDGVELLELAAVIGGDAANAERAID